MAAAGARGSRGDGAGRSRSHRGSGGAPAPRRQAASGQKPRGARPAPAAPAAPPLPPGPFRLGAIEGATPGKWIDLWKERMPRHALELVPLGIADQAAAVAEASVDAGLVRLPMERAGAQLIPLYDEIAVVVCAADSHLTAADELTLADLAGEVVITPRHAPLELTVPEAVLPSFAPPESVEDAISIVASGVGVVVVPMSLARLHHRRDTAYRPLTDAPHSSVALAWRPGPDGAAPPLVDVFIGIVRGRTANSSR